MARKAKDTRPSYNIECLKNGAWLWVIMPPYRNKAEADSAALKMEERHPGGSFRVVEA